METMCRFLTDCYLLKCIILIYAFIDFGSVFGVEEPHREIFLRPRNFNPHPYQADVRASRRIASDRGPILFPPSPAPSTEKSNFIRVGNTYNNNRNTGHPVDNHPYPKVADKHRFSNPGRHQVYENEIDPQISAALSNHADKVLGRPSSIYPAGGNTIDEHKKYAFSYKVVDHLTGDDFSHTQSQNEKATRGEYRVKLPDGRVQIVSYTADKNGYKADVKYEDEILRAQQKTPRGREYTRNQIFAYTNSNYEDARFTYDQAAMHVALKSTSATPIHENHIEDYDYGNAKPVVYAPAPTQSSDFIFAVTRSSHRDYLPATPAPLYGYENIQDQHPDHRFHVIPRDKVEVVNQGDAPAYLENPGVILSSTPSPSSFSGDYQHVFVTRLPDIYSGKK